MLVERAKQPKDFWQVGGEELVNLASAGRDQVDSAVAAAKAAFPVWSRMPFAVASDNFYAGARRGIEADQRWPGLGTVPVRDLVLHHLLPVAAAGLDQLGVAAEARDRYLGVIERRCALGANGATWQIEAAESFDRTGDPEAAMRRLVVAYREHMHGGEPAHTWPVP